LRRLLGVGVGLFVALSAVSVVLAVPSFAQGDDLPVAALSLDENSGKVAHDSVNDHDATLHGAGWTEAGKYGSALNFNGENAYLSIPDSDELDFTDGFTLEAWVKPQGVQHEEPIITKQTSNFYSYQLYAGGKNTAHKPEGFISDAAFSWEEVAGEEDLPTEAWSHLAFTYDGEDIRLYVDGELVDTEEAPSAQVGTGPLTIGGNQFGHFFEGTIDEIRLYGDALGPARIRKDRDTPIGLPPRPVAALSFDEGSGGIAHDSAHDHDATLHGAGWTEAGKYGSALHFNGENAYLSIPDSDELDFTDGFTLEAWVKPEGAQEQAPVIEKQSGS
jgi:hypothetical protein